MENPITPLVTFKFSETQSFGKGIVTEEGK